MNREAVALNMLRIARRALVDDIVSAVLESDHMADFGELPPFSDEITDAGERLAELNRTIFALEDAMEEPTKSEHKPKSNPWIHSETT